MKIDKKFIAIFSLSLVSMAVHSAVLDDCSKGNCVDKNMSITTPDYFNAPTVNYSGNSKVVIEKGGVINNSRVNFKANSELIVNSDGAITGKANIWALSGGTVSLNSTNSMTGGQYTSNGVGKGGVLNLNATKSISGGKLLLDQDAIVNINASNAIVGLKGSNLRFKGNAVINLNHENSLTNAILTLEDDSRINVNADNALGFTNNINFAKTYNTKKGSVLELNGHSVTVGTISGNDTNATIVNSGAKDSFIYSGLTNYGVLAGKTYKYSEFLKTGIIRADAVISTALGDVTRQAVLTMLPQLSDRIVPEPSGIALNGRGVWLKTLYGNEKRKGDGITSPEWKGHNTGVQVGFDIFPENEDATNKLGLYVGWLNGKSDIIGKSIYSNNDIIGKYHLNMYGGGLYHRYTTSQGWYINSILQWAAYNGDASQTTSSYKAKVSGNSLLVSTEMGYPIPLNESFTILPRISLDYQRLMMKNYQFENLAVHNDLDNLLRASGGARLYYNIMSVSGVQWSPFFGVDFITQLAARDKTNVRVINSGYQQRLLTIFAGSQFDLATGVTVKVNDYLHYYAKIEMLKEFKYQAKNEWGGSMGISFYW